MWDDSIETVSVQADGSMAPANTFLFSCLVAFFVAILLFVQPVAY